MATEQLELIKPGAKLEELVFHRGGLSWDEAILSNPDDTDGVRITLQHHPSCHRRGPHKLLIEVLGTPYHHNWGCFDDQDQPARWYHDVKNARSEALLLAQMLLDQFHD